jgi:bisphosphoglycerate-independent phosphoglycerate mutase (AlkP superfamily)
VDRRLVLIVIDGLGYQTSVNHRGFLESLVHGGKARAPTVLSRLGLKAPASMKVAPLG